MNFQIFEKLVVHLQNSNLKKIEKKLVRCSCVTG